MIYSFRVRSVYACSQGLRFGGGFVMRLWLRDRMQKVLAEISSQTFDYFDP